FNDSSCPSNRRFAKGDCVAPSDGGADLSTPDLAIPDLATPDLTTFDFATPDLTTFDFATPDLTTFDLVTHDLTTFDLTTHDLTTLDMTTFDLFMCSNNTVLCSGNCINVMSTDATNCGACGHACHGSETCSAGLCSPTTLASIPGEPEGIAVD